MLVQLRNHLSGTQKDPQGARIRAVASKNRLHKVPVAQRSRPVQRDGGSEANKSLLRNNLTLTHFGVINQRLCPPICSHQCRPHNRRLSVFIHLSFQTPRGFHPNHRRLRIHFHQYISIIRRRHVWRSVVFSQLFVGQITQRPYLLSIC